MKPFLKISAAILFLIVTGYSALSGDSLCTSCSTCTIRSSCEKK